MRLDRIALTPANVERTVTMWPDRCTYTQPALQRTLVVLRALLEQRRALGCR
jgi:hypothetical protein